MNPIQDKLKIYTYSLTALSVICTVLNLLCYLLTFDTELHYFSASSPLPAISNAVLILSLLWALSSMLFLPGKALRPIQPGNSTATVFAASLCGFIFLFFSGRELIAYLTVGFYPNSTVAPRRDLIVYLLTIFTGLISSAYFFTTLIPACRRAGWLILLGFAPILWSVVTLARAYFDFYHPMNEPTKIAVILALIAAALALLQELRMLLDRHQPRLALLFHYFALLLCGVTGIAGTIASTLIPTLADYATVFPLIASLWLYFAARTFAHVREQLTPVTAAEESNNTDTESETA